MATNQDKPSVSNSESCAQTRKEEIAAEIWDFLDQHAPTKPGYDPGDEDGLPEYKSPEAFALAEAALKLENGDVPESVWTDWRGGGYEGGKEAREWYDSILKKIRSFQMDS
jgi:hypothetical protein